MKHIVRISARVQVEALRSSRGLLQAVQVTPLVSGHDITSHRLAQELRRWAALQSPCIPLQMELTEIHQAGGTDLDAPKLRLWSARARVIPGAYHEVVLSLALGTGIAQMFSIMCQRSRLIAVVAAGNGEY